MNLFCAKQYAVLGAMIAVLAFLSGCLVSGQKPQKKSSPPASQPDLLHASLDQLHKHAVGKLKEYTILDRPKWEVENWKDKCEVFLLGGCGPADKKNTEAKFHPDHSLQIPPQAKTDGNEIIGFNSKPIVQIVYYNDIAAKHIMDYKLFNQAKLEKQRNKNKDNIPKLTIPDFDSKSVIVKTIWQPIYPDDSTPTNYSFFWFYDKSVKCKAPQGKAPQDPCVLDAVDSLTWPYAYVDTTNTGSCARSQASDGHYIYSLKCFLYQEIFGDEVNHLPDNIGSSLLHGQCKEKKCYLLFMGMHIITRETPNWVWMTYWWTNEGRQASVTDKWEFFEAAVSTNNQEQTPIANPYLEGPTSGMSSNCLDCHRFAAYNPSFTSKIGTQYGGDPVKMHAKDFQSPTCYFKNSLRTHFLWTIAVHQNDSIGQSSDPCPK